MHTLGMTNAHRPQWVPDTDHFAVRLVLVRHQMGWNAKEAALACGISPQSWREWELSGRRPRDYEGVCKQIAARTGCNLIWLMAGNPNPQGGMPDTAVGGSLPRVDSNHQPFGQRFEGDEAA
jgi:transcriptional regulator with XRE-family HTH domain